MKGRFADLADELEERAEAADEVELADAYTVLAAVARDELPPTDVSRRVLRRARDA